MAGAATATTTSTFDRSQSAEESSRVGAVRETDRQNAVVLFASLFNCLLCAYGDDCPLFFLLFLLLGISSGCVVRSVCVCVCKLENVAGVRRQTTTVVALAGESTSSSSRSHGRGHVLVDAPLFACLNVASSLLTIEKEREKTMEIMLLWLLFCFVRVVAID